MDYNNVIQKEENPLNNHRLPSSELTYVSHLGDELSNESALVIAAGDNKTSLQMILDDWTMFFRFQHIPMRNTH